MLQSRGHTTAHIDRGMHRQARIECMHAYIAQASFIYARDYVHIRQGNV